MEPITIITLLVLGGAVARISLAAIERWIQRNKVPNGTAEIVRKRLANGQVMVVTGVFDSGGSQVASKTWQGKRLDSALEARFSAEGDVIYVHT